MNVTIITICMASPFLLHIRDKVWMLTNCKWIYVFPYDVYVGFSLCKFFAVINLTLISFLNPVYFKWLLKYPIIKGILKLGRDILTDIALCIFVILSIHTLSIVLTYHCKHTIVNRILHCGQIIKKCAKKSKHRLNYEWVLSLEIKQKLP